MNEKAKKRVLEIARKYQRDMQKIVDSDSSITGISISSPTLTQGKEITIATKSKNKQ